MLSLLPNQLDAIRPRMMELLASVKEYLHLEVSFISELKEGERIIHFIDAPFDFPLRVGDLTPAAETYCGSVAEGRMPHIVTDAKRSQAAAAFPATEELSIGATVIIPIYRDNGEIYGTLCCISTSARLDLGNREYEFARMAGALGQGLIHQALATSEETLSNAKRLKHIIQTNAIDTVFQPIYRLRDTRLVAFEALSRFPGEPPLSPDRWFSLADEIGCGIQLETLAARRAIASFQCFDVSLSFNLSPAAILSGSLDQILFGQDLQRFVVEITEHAPIDDYSSLNAKLASFREKGLRVAIDDVGAGHSSFRHILELHPELIKLDRSLTHNIDLDLGRRALARALTAFSREMGCEVVAEGVETDSEMAHLRAVGVTKIQGYYLGRPMSVAEASELPRSLKMPELSLS